MRRNFTAVLLLPMALSAATSSGEALYNGIVLPDEWPPRYEAEELLPMPVPYLEKANLPAVIPIDLGRQLFVDDFLIESSEGIERVYGKPKKYEGNPVLKPETPWEINTPFNSIALPKGGGMWWDEERQRFHLWYEAGWCREVCYAWSKDGVRWERPSLDVLPGSNRVMPEQKVDSWSVVPQYDAQGVFERWNFFVNTGGTPGPGVACTSKDGIHWEGFHPTGLSGDRSTMFYNPFRRKWVWSLRAVWSYRDGFCRRSRIYHEGDDFIAGSDWSWPAPRKKRGEKISQQQLFRSYTNTVDCVRWLAADDADVQTGRTNENSNATVYCFDAVAYESIMLGAFEMHWGPENPKCAKVGLPKITDIQFAYSRDGFHFSRPDRTAAIASERWENYGKKWDVGYVQPLSNLCVIKGDELWFYYGAFGGDKNRLVPKGNVYGGLSLNGIYQNGAMGLATMRRDAFVGLKADAKGVVTTRPIRFSGSKLFVNLAAPKGSLKVDVLDVSGAKLAELKSVSGDKTKLAVGDVGKFAGQDVRLSFTLEDATLYSFWVSKDKSGKSGGYLAGGGPGYRGLRDE